MHTPSFSFSILIFFKATISPVSTSWALYTCLQMKGQKINLISTFCILIEKPKVYKTDRNQDVDWQGKTRKIRLPISGHMPSMPILENHSTTCNSSSGLTFTVRKKFFMPHFLPMHTGIFSATIKKMMHNWNISTLTILTYRISRR